MFNSILRLKNKLEILMLTSMPQANFTLGVFSIITALDLFRVLTLSTYYIGTSALALSFSIFAVQKIYLSLEPRYNYYLVVTDLLAAYAWAVLGFAYSSFFLLLPILLLFYTIVGTSLQLGAEKRRRDASRFNLPN